MSKRYFGLKPKQVAEALNVSVKTVYRWIAKELRPGVEKIKTINTVFGIDYKIIIDYHTD